MTIHITPEAKFSYVSFESNIPQSSYMDVIARVLQTFRPGKFIITAFANKVNRKTNSPVLTDSEPAFRWSYRARVIGGDRFLKKKFKISNFYKL